MWERRMGRVSDDGRGSALRAGGCSVVGEGKEARLKDEGARDRTGRRLGVVIFGLTGYVMTVREGMKVVVCVDSRVVTVVEGILIVDCLCV